jgi:hypothetical protein
VFAEIGKPDRQLFTDLLAHRVADANLAGCRKRLDPRRDVDAVAKHVAFVDHDIAKVDANAKTDALYLRQIGIAVLHPSLDDDGTAYGVDDRGKLDQHAVAGGLKDAAAMLVDHGVNQFAPVALQNGERLFLVRTHQPRIFDHIGAEDRRQPPLYPFLRHASAPRLAPSGYQSCSRGSISVYRITLRAKRSDYTAKDRSDSSPMTQGVTYWARNLNFKSIPPAQGGQQTGSDEQELANWRGGCSAVCPLGP